LASAGPVEPLHRYFLTPDADAEVEELGEICEAAGMLWAATAGVVLSRGGETLPLPGLPDHRLLTRGSPIVTAAARELANSCTHTSFLAPVPADDQQGLVRVTALDCARPDLDDLSQPFSSPRLGTSAASGP
jgi:hypothetical protein